MLLFADFRFVVVFLLMVICVVMVNTHLFTFADCLTFLEVCVSSAEVIELRHLHSVSEQI